MTVTLEEMKQYLRIDHPDDDELLTGMIADAERLCLAVARAEDAAVLDNAKIAVMYAVAYLYEHREDADHKTLTLSLRALLTDVRQEGF